jgi:putative two-component system response regulator
LESGEHVKRTQLYVGAIIDHLINSRSRYSDALGEMQPEIIVKSMALHDVGKIAIPDRILLKPGRLDADEYEIMKTHTTRGKEIIGEMGDVDLSLYIKHCEDICYSHHERWDGKGYPQGLIEEGIPLAARIASLADVYDALVSARVYKAAMSYADAVKIIADGRGTQFDPLIADTLIEIQDEFAKIAKVYM